ncbi:head decoration protein [Agrobacterium sp. SHOUNA12C]|nr:head decoration protein [Agrobacterium sp. BETTINA12B]MCJ9757015.1 head decoration protein [Agrobacterium sp. SHOUNA12C]
MAEILELNHDEEFLFSEANGTKSRATVTLVQSTRVYQPGDIVMNTGASGAYVLATNALADANANALYGIVNRKSNAVAAAKKASVINADAEVKAGYLTFGDSTVLSDLTPALLLQGIKVLPDAA